MSTSPLLTESEAGQILRLPTSRVTRMARTGHLPCVELPGNELRFIESELLAWVERHRRPGNDGEAHATPNMAKG
jgi:excisionase family DNA binding protein